MTEERKGNYIDHSLFLADIAKSILTDGGCLSVKGVPEIIAAYLLMPYIPTGGRGQLRIEENLKYELSDEAIEEMFDEFGYKASDYRNTLAHSFITKEDNSDTIIFDDRIKGEQTTGTICERIPISKLNKLEWSIINKLKE